MKLADIEIEVKKLDLKKGELLIVKTPRHMTMKLQADLHSLLGKILPDGVKAIVHEKDVDVTVVKSMFNHTSVGWPGA